MAKQMQQQHQRKRLHTKEIISFVLNAVALDSEVDKKGVTEDYFRQIQELHG